MSAEQPRVPAKDETRFQVGRLAYLPKATRLAFYALIILGLCVYLYYTFGPVRIAGKFLVLEQYNYFYLLFALFGSCVFIAIPARKSDRKRIGWYDYVLASFMFATNLYFFSNAQTIQQVGWIPPRTTLDLILAGGFCLACLESGRRLGGYSFFIICLLALAYPLIGGMLPGIMKGTQYPLQHVLGVFAFGRQGALGMPAGVLGDVIIGFLVFCAILLATGAGDFFINLAMSLFGRFRGGPAKVTVISSCLFGTVTGNPLAAVLTIGGVTVPAMKRCGYSGDYAGGILADAALGTQVMPPVMGTIAFIMAVLINVPYTEIMIAATLPAILYYYGLVLQVDGYAGRNNLKGMTKAELPSARLALRTGWPFLIVIGFLVFGLIYMRWSGGEAGIYAAVLCLLLSFIYKETRLKRDTIGPTLGTIGYMIVQTVSVLLPSAFIIAGLQMTGTLGNLVAQIVGLSGASSFVILVAAAVICFVFGMVGISLIAYLILAATMAPALAQASGMDIIGLHLFIAYFAITGAITPPVALVAFVAAAFVGAPPMKTAWTATRLGIVIYFLPFFFVYDKSLLLRGPMLDTIFYFSLCLIGIGMISSGVEGYLPKGGTLRWWMRVPLIVGGFLVAMPAGWEPLAVGTVILIVTLAAIFLLKRRERLKAPPVS